MVIKHTYTLELWCITSDTSLMHSSNTDPPIIRGCRAVSRAPASTTHCHPPCIGTCKMKMANTLASWIELAKPPPIWCLGHTEMDSTDSLSFLPTCFYSNLLANFFSREPSTTPSTILSWRILRLIPSSPHPPRSTTERVPGRWRRYQMSSHTSSYDSSARWYLLGVCLGVRQTKS